jgi:hypothetical protein
VELLSDSHGWDEEIDARWEDFNAELEAMIGLPVDLLVSEGAEFERPSIGSPAPRLEEPRIRHTGFELAEL